MKTNSSPADADKSLLFATAFYHATGRSPNAWTFSPQAKLAMYYRCMVVCYASIQRLYPQARLVLFSNTELPEPYANQLASLGVKTVILDGRYVVDSAFSNNFPGCLYTLDVIAYLSKQTHDFQHLILLDNDCIMRRRLDELFDGADNQAISAYAIGYEAAAVANGQSRASLTLALSYLQQKMLDHPILMYGGEFFAIPSGQLATMAQNIETFWSWMKNNGISLFGNQLTEEHVMSVALAMQPERIRKVTTEIKRIWTTEHFSTVVGNESEISIWHLPSEKKKGLAKLYRYWQQHKGFNNFSDDEFNKVVNSLIGLRINKPKNKLIQLYYRFYNAAKYIITGRI